MLSVAYSPSCAAVLGSIMRSHTPAWAGGQGSLSSTTCAIFSSRPSGKAKSCWPSSAASTASLPRSPPSSPKPWPTWDAPHLWNGTHQRSSPFRSVGLGVPGNNKSVLKTSHAGCFQSGKVTLKRHSAPEGTNVPDQFSANRPLAGRTMNSSRNSAQQKSTHASFLRYCAQFSLSAKTGIGTIAFLPRDIRLRHGRGQKIRNAKCLCADLFLCGKRGSVLQFKFAATC